MANVKKFPSINKAAFKLVEVEDVKISDTVYIQWGIKGDETCTETEIPADDYAEFLRQHGYIEDGQMCWYESMYDYTERAQHARELIACVEPIQHTISSLQKLVA